MLNTVPMNIAKTALSFLILSFFTTAGMSQNISISNAELIGGPCEGCEAVFEFGDRPLSPVDTLYEFEQADEKLKLTGTIYRPDGKTPAAGVILYIYHTNAKGVYPTRGDESGWAKRHGYLRGWIKTASDGKYTFFTQKPGSYGEGPAHIHPTVLEPDGKYYYIDMYVFESDPNLSNSRKNRRNSRGGSGVVELKREGNLLVAKRDIILGLNVPGYE